MGEKEKQEKKQKTMIRCFFINIFPSLTLQKKVSLNYFLDTLMSDPPPQCLVWLPLMHRLANVENGEITLCNVCKTTSCITKFTFATQSI